MKKSYKLIHIGFKSLVTLRDLDRLESPKSRPAQMLVEMSDKTWYIPNVIEYNPSIIHLTGDKEYEAVENYFIVKHNKSLDSFTDNPKNFACNFLYKYHAEVILVKDKYGRIYYYPKFFQF